jgi:acyl dehydratase
VPAIGPHVIPASIVGETLGAVSLVITARKVMAFAAGLGVTRRCYYEDAPLAPPAMAVALEWPLLNGTRYRQLLRAPQEVMERAIHLQQASVFHRALRTGAAVSTSGSVLGLRQSRRGVVVQVGLRTIDDAGDTLTESKFTALVLGSRLDCTPLAEPERREAEAPNRWDRHAHREAPLLAAHIFSECSGIWNPIHTEAPAARRAGLDAPILHGTWTWAVGLEQAIDWWADGDPERVESWLGEFVAPLLPAAPVEFAGALANGKALLEMRQGSRTCLRAEGKLRP